MTAANDLQNMAGRTAADSDAAKPGGLGQARWPRPGRGRIVPAPPGI